MLGKYVIVRTYSAGVHAGVLARHEGREVELTGSRRLWRWQTADKGISLSDVATGGINPKGSRVCAALEKIVLTEAIEIIPATDAARSTIEAADVARG
ncbi:MAG: hypothetical protein KAX54_00160 [Thauera sp.]|nr:hypothetical protein [Thauera sp.]